MKWMSESLHPFQTAADRGFLELMKTGQPGYYVPSPSPISHDVKIMFANTCKRLAWVLCVSRGSLAPIMEYLLS